MIKRFVPFAALFLLSGLAACGPKLAAPERPVASLAVEAPPRAPAVVWADSCHYCHDTGIGPPVLGRAMPADSVKLVVRQGLNQMPAFLPNDITDAELDALAVWIEESAVPVAPRAGAAK